MPFGFIWYSLYTQYIKKKKKNPYWEELRCYEFQRSLVQASVHVYIELDLVKDWHFCSLFPLYSKSGLIWTKEILWKTGGIQACVSASLRLFHYASSWHPNTCHQSQAVPLHIQIGAGIPHMTMCTSKATPLSNWLLHQLSYGGK